MGRRALRVGEYQVRGAIAVMAEDAVEQARPAFLSAAAACSRSDSALSVSSGRRAAWRTIRVMRLVGRETQSLISAQRCGEMI